VDLGSKARDLEQARWLRENLAERAKALGIPIFGIALSKAADFQLIQSVAQVSGGEYYRVLAASDIPATLEQIRSRVEAVPAEPQKEPQPEPIAETAPPSDPIPAPVEPVVDADPPPTAPESVSGWEKIPAEWRPWLLLAFGLIALGIVGIVAVGRSRRDRPKKYPFIKHFKYSFIITAVGLIAAFLYGGPFGMLIAAILGVLEVSLSFDNAVVNASVLKDMEPKWQIMFLTVGILIAVFGMRLLFPILIVSIIAQIGFTEVVRMALEAPDLYAQHLQAAHIQIAAFGGMFLLLVFLGFLLDEEKELHWLRPAEDWLARMGRLASVEVVLALTALIVASYFLPEAERAGMFIAGISGIILYVLVDSVDALFEVEEAGEAVKKTAKRAGFTGFLYLEVLDASFSFDGVIGAFAITKDVIIIMLGLMIGAMFVRSITVYLVRKGTLDEYVFLEHGAHYAIGALAFIMLATMVVHIPEAITGLIGVAFIGLAVYSSVRYRQQQASP
jgi:hypothetical protein